MGSYHTKPPLKHLSPTSDTETRINDITQKPKSFCFFKASQGHYVGIRRAGMGGVGLDLVGSEDRSYRTPSVRFLHGQVREIFEGPIRETL